MNATTLSVRPFAATSLWNRPLSRHARLDRSSPAMVAALRRMMAAKSARGMQPGIAVRTYSPTVYQVGPGVARVPVHIDSVGAWTDSLRAALAGGVPIPAGAVPSGGIDEHLAVYQPSSDTYWEFWRAQLEPDGWHARWGGVIRRVSRSAGYYTTAPARDAWRWGATATGLPMIAGLIRPSELRSGRIEHAVAVMLGAACNGSHAFPAQSDDGFRHSPDCIPEGARLRLPARLNLRALHLPRATLTIARAVQRYGMIVNDTDGGQPSFEAEDTGWTGVDAYGGRAGALGGQFAFQVASAFPWGRLQVLRLHLCRRGGPCRP